MAELEQIVAKFVADVDGYTNGMERVSKSTQKAVSESTSQFNKLDAKIRGVFGGLIAGLGVTAIYKASRATLDWSDNIKTLSERLNTSTDSIQELIYAGREVNITAASMTSGMQNFATAVSEAATGRGRGVEAFKSLGLTAADAKKDLSELFDLFAERVKEFNRPSQIALAKSFFGADAGMQFLDLLGKGKGKLDELRQAARDAGVVLNSELISRGEAMNKEVERLTDQINANLRQAFVELGPVIIEALKGALAFIRETKEFILWASGKAAPGDKKPDFEIRIRPPSWKKPDREEGYYWKPGMPGFQRYTQANIPPEPPPTPDQQAEIDRFKREADRMNRRTTPTAPEGRRQANLGGDELLKFEQKIKELKVEARALQTELLFDKPYAEFQKMVDAFEQGNEKMKPLADQTRRFREEAQKVYDRKALIAIKEYGRETQDIIRLTEAEATGNSQVVALMQEKINLEKQLGETYAKTHPEVIERLAKERVEANRNLVLQKENVENLKGAVVETGQAFASAFGEAITSGAKFSDVLKGLERDLMRIAMNRLIMQPLFGGSDGGVFGRLASSLIGSVTGSTGGGDWFTGGFSSSRGNIFSGGIRPHGKGGMVSSMAAFPMGDGRLGTVAEKKPEAIFPIVRTGSGDLGVRAIMPGGSNQGLAGMLKVTIENNTPSKASAETTPQGDLIIILDQANEQLISRQGSRTNRALQRRFGAQPQTVQR